MNSRYKNYSYHQNMNQRLPAPKKPKRGLPIAKLVLAFACLFVVFAIAKTIFGSGDSKSTAAVQSAPQEPPKRVVDTSKLQSSIDAITKQYPYNTSVSVVDLNSGKRIQSGDTYPFIAASTTKLLTALAYFTEVEAGKESLSATIGGQSAKKQLQLMINKSDNPAWKSLNDELTKESLVTYAKTHGVSSYDAADNKVTANDMAQLMAKLYKRQLLNDENTKLLLSWMQNTSEERFIPAALPEGATVYHKAGYLEDRVHDVAIIDNGSAPFVLVIYSKSYTKTYDYTVGQELYKQITQQVFTTFK